MTRRIAPMIDWDDVRVFCTLARAGSLAAAARQLGINHATVGRRITALESALGVRLVDRLPRNTPLTHDGAKIAALAGEMERLAQRIDRAARDASATLDGNVTVSAPPALATAFVAPRLHSLRAQHPALTVTLLSQSTLASLDAGEADIAIRLAAPEHPQHIVRTLGQLALGLFANAETAALPSSEWTFIGYDAQLFHVPHHRWFEDYVRGRPILIRTSDVYAQVAAAQQGLGVAMLPRFMAEPDLSLVRVDPSAGPPPRTISLVIHADLRRAPAVRAAADFLIDQFTHAPEFAASGTSHK
jgi:DNA-binding transcriptional LysR family regulator